MKILLVGQAYYRRDNGQAVFTINLAEGLAAAGHQVLVVAPSLSGKAARSEEHGVIVQTVPALALIDNTNVTAFCRGLIARTIDKFQPDVVHVQDHYFLSRSVLAIARARRLPAVGTNHFLPENLTDNLPVTLWARKALDRLLWSTMLSAYNHLGAVSTPTETAAKILRAQGIHVPVTAISCGVNVERFQPRPQLDRLVLRARYGIAPDKLIVCYVGRLDREKDLDVLIKAVAQLDRDDLQWSILAVKALAEQS
ncbi:MAG: glycosyltransferase [Caldilineaceae bacterium]